MTDAVMSDERDMMNCMNHHERGTMMIPIASLGRSCLYPYLSELNIVAIAINISSIAYIKYVTLDTTIQSSWIIGRIWKRSPLVQSGDMSQLTRMIAGVTTIVRISRMILSPATSDWSISCICASWVDLSRSSFNPGFWAANCISVNAWVLITHELIVPLFVIFTPKNPIIPERRIHIYVADFLNIAIYILY